MTAARCLLAVLALIVLAPEPTRAEREPLRSQVDFGFSDSPAAFLSATRALRRVAADQARIMVLWREPDRPEIDQSVAMMRRIGVKPWLAVWGLEAPDPDGYTEICAQLARRYPDATIELWNEPNILLFGDLSVAESVPIYLRCYGAIREVNPSQRIVGPSIAPVGGDWESYARALYSKLPPDVGLGLHL